MILGIIIGFILGAVVLAVIIKWSFRGVEKSFSGEEDEEPERTVPKRFLVKE